MAIVIVLRNLAVGYFRCILVVILRLIQICRSLFTKLNHDSHLLERIFEFIKECFAVHTFASHLEQKAQACMARVRVDTMFANDFVVCFEERPEWKSIGFGFCLSAGDNLVEKTDIYS
jgi:uncharacterized membrane protein